MLGFGRELFVMCEREEARTEGGKNCNSKKIDCVSLI